MGFKKYPSIERLGTEETKDILMFNEDFINVEEKVDGGNGSFWLEDGKIHYGSRNRDLTSEEDKKTFARYRLAMEENLKNKEINPDYIYYIEWMQKHTISYTNAPSYIGLDIRLKHSANTEDYGLFLGRETKEKEFERLNIECAPLVWKGIAGDLKKLNINELIPKSKYYDGLAEGIVIKNYSRKSTQGNYQLFAKVVRDEFKECNKAVFGGVKQKNSDTSKIVEEFVTDARVRKIILKQINEFNRKLELALMRFVPSEVIKDVLKEEFGGIFDKYYFIDFKEMKDLTNKVCLRVIKEMLMENIK